MRISDWSSDVCSSDLLAAHCTRITAAARLASFLVFGQLVEATLLGVLVDFGATNLASADEIGRASCRERVCVRVDLGGRRIIKKKKKINNYNKYANKTHKK